MADKRRFRGPGGAVFVPHPTVDEHTIKQNVELGEWSEVEEAEQKPARAPRKRAASKK